MLTVITELGGGGGGRGKDGNGNGSVKEGCNNWILTIEDKIDHPGPRPRPSFPLNVGVGWAELPVVFLSGSLHGNERVVPAAVVGIASLLFK